MAPVIVAYIPVLHEGYRRLFERHPDARELCLFGSGVIASYEHLIKDIRALDPALVQKAITAWNLFDRVTLLDTQRIQELQNTKTPIIVSDDDLTTELIQRHFLANPIEKDTVFLRWDKKTSIAPQRISPDTRVSEEAFDRSMMNLARTEGEKSRDWWRRIGAVAVKDGAVILQTHNTGVPSDHIAYDEGDPRSNFKSGVHLESSLFLHAEAGLIAQAAKRGISLDGVDVYVDTFPCPPCAKQLAYAGIRTLYYQKGYAVLDGERILRSQGVQIVFVDVKQDEEPV